MKTPNKSVKSLVKEFQEIDSELVTLDQITNRVYFDGRTVMPSAAEPQNATHMAYLGKLSHEIKTSKKFVKLLEDLSKQKNTSQIAAALRLYKKDVDRAKKLSSDFVVAREKQKSLSEKTWEKAREQNNYETFAPEFKKVITHIQKECELFDKKKASYDQCLDYFSDGVNIAMLTPIFEELKRGILIILSQVKRSQKYKTYRPLNLNISKNNQMLLVDDVITMIVSDPTRYTSAISTHPFSCRNGPNDQRLTVNYRDDPFFSFTSAAHECGHSLYEGQIDSKYATSIVGNGNGITIHESQSKLWEKMVMSSKDFWIGYTPKFNKITGLNLTSDQLYMEANALNNSLIRIEGDELRYNLHIIIRFEIEAALLSGKIKVEDIPKIWNQKYLEYFGVTPKNTKEGCLQDSHWSNAYIGYFPSYTLGNLYSAMIWEKLKKEHPNLSKDIQTQNFSFIKGWLKENIHKHGSLYPPTEFMEKVLGKPLSVDAYLTYLREKYFDLYEIN